MEAIFFYTFLSIIVCLLITRKLFGRRRYPNLPPSPLSLPILGHLHFLKPPNHRTFHRLSQKYGPIFSLWFGSSRVVVISSSSGVQECFTKNDIVLANRPPTLMSKFFGYNQTNLANAPYGEHWRNVRRIGTVEVLSTGRLNSFADVRKDEVKHLLRKLSRNAEEQGGHYVKVQLRSLLYELTFNNIMTMVAGKRYLGDHVANEEEGKEFIEIMDEAFSYSVGGNPGEFMPFLRWFGANGYEKKVKRLGKRSDVFLQRLIDEHRNKSGSESKNTMIDHLLSQQESQPEYYTDEIIKGLIQSILLAGTDTSAVTIEWAMSNLLNHPDVLKKARAELDAHLGEERLVDEPDISKLHYLQNIISETLRLYPAAPMLLPHYASDDCVVGGFNIPRETLVMINAWAIHRDPKLWDDSESFKPERFETSTKDDLAHKFIPFGIGRRSCPGGGLANREVGLTLASLIQCFEWEKVSEEEVDMTEGEGLTMPKRVPLEAMYKSRPVVKKVFH